MDQRRGIFFAMMLVAAWTMLLFLFLPNFVAVPVSLTPERYLSMPGGEISLRHYIKLFTDAAWLSSIADSFIIGLGAMALAVVLGTLCAVGIWRLASRWSEAMLGLALMPLIVPPIVSALAFYRLYIDLGWLDTYHGMIVAHTILAVPYVVITVSASLANFDPKLEQAARNLGASMGQTLRFVIVPQIMPGILSGAVFAFATSWDELVVTLFITSRAVFTLPRRMWDGIREHVDPTIAAAATALLLLTLIAIAVVVYWAWRRQRATAIGQSIEQQVTASTA